MTELDALMARLCTLLDEEAERQETVQAVVRAQEQAILVRDLHELEARTAALVLLVQDASVAERQRMALMEAIVGLLELPVEQQTLTGLIAAVPEPWAGRLKEFQKRVRNVMQDSRQTIRENRVMMRRALRVVNEALALLVPPQDQPPTGYTLAGAAPGPAHAAASILDQRG